MGEREGDLREKRPRYIAKEKHCYTPANACCDFTFILDI